MIDFVNHFWKAFDGILVGFSLSVQGDHLVLPFLDEGQSRLKLRRVVEKKNIHAHGIADVDENRVLEFSAPSRRALRVKNLGVKSKALKHKLKRLRSKSGGE